MKYSSQPAVAAPPAAGNVAVTEIPRKDVVLERSIPAGTETLAAVVPAGAASRPSPLIGRRCCGGARGSDPCHPKARRGPLSLQRSALQRFFDCISLCEQLRGLGRMCLKAGGVGSGDRAVRA